jgi:ferredoxin-NADP reductase
VFDTLERVNNPLIRSLIAGSAIFSAVTLATALTLGVTKTKSSSAYQVAIYTSLLAGGCGAIMGAVYTTKRSSAPTASPTGTDSANTYVWKDWRNFTVVRKVKESDEITSFYLQPQDQQEIPQFQPGQFLTIKLDIPEQNKPVIRTYSLSDYSKSPTYYRLSIKREPPPKGLDVPPGLSSNFMHDCIQEGSVIPAKPPNGRFVLAVENTNPVFLISNGVGITPMISMAKACTLLNPNRPLWFIHGARDGKFHAFREEMQQLAQQNPRLNIHFRYSRPTEEDSGHYQSVGYVDTGLVRELVQAEAEYFLCGSPSFMQSIREGLKELEIPESRVFFESFSKPSPTVSQPKTDLPIEKTSAQTEIVLAKSGKTIQWQAGDSSILELAEANGIDPPYSCRVGICGTCMCKISEGEVTYQEPPTANIEPGSILICISQPKTSRIVINI